MNPGNERSSLKSPVQTIFHVLATYNINAPVKTSQGTF